MYSDVHLHKLQQIDLKYNQSKNTMDMGGSFKYSPVYQVCVSITKEST